MNKIILKEAEVDPLDDSIECVDCGGRAYLDYVDDMVGERRVRGWARVCSCGARYACNSAGTPMSRPADARTRYLRARAHEAFDCIWRTNSDRGFHEWLQRTTRNRRRAAQKMAKTRRRNCYRWLAAQMGLPNVEDASIGRMNAAQCENVLAICEGVTWDQVDAWTREHKDKSSESSKTTIHRRKPKRRPSRLLGPEDDEGEHWR